MPSLLDYVIAHGKTRGHQPTILLADRVITYAMLAAASLRAEAKIADLRLPHGSIIGICVRSPIRHFALLSAIIRGGHTGISVYKIADIAILGVRAACVLTEKLDCMPASRQAVADHVSPDDAGAAGRSGKSAAPNRQGRIDPRRRALRCSIGPRYRICLNDRAHALEQPPCPGQQNPKPPARTFTAPASVPGCLA